jgi:hypothetical protein
MSRLQHWLRKNIKYYMNRIMICTILSAVLYFIITLSLLLLLSLTFIYHLQAFAMARKVSRRVK